MAAPGTCTIESTGASRRYRLERAYPGHDNSVILPFIFAAVLGGIAVVIGQQGLAGMFDTLHHGSPASFAWWLDMVLSSPALILFGGSSLLCVVALVLGMIGLASREVSYLACDAGGVMRWRVSNACSGFSREVEYWSFETILDVRRAGRDVMLETWSAHGGISIVLARLTEAEADRLVAWLKEDLAAAAQAWSAAGLVIHRG